jgi:hypothetical protein
VEKRIIVLLLALNVAGCGEEYNYTLVGGACATIVQGNEVYLGPTYSTVNYGGCSGVYIAPGVIMTAGHCGDQQWAEADDITRNNVKWVPHPHFEYPWNDIGLAFLDGELPRDIAMLGIPEYGIATIQGYGVDENGVAGILREGTTYIESFWAPNTIVTSPGPDACFGDSGGPIYQNGAVVGITQSANVLTYDPMDACGLGGRYTIVINFREWLDSEVEGLNWVGSCELQ